MVNVIQIRRTDGECGSIVIRFSVTFYSCLKNTFNTFLILTINPEDSHGLFNFPFESSGGDTR